jgi:hypothetical protein
MVGWTADSWADKTAGKRAVKSAESMVVLWVGAMADQSAENSAESTVVMTAGNSAE